MLNSFAKNHVTFRHAEVAAGHAAPLSAPFKLFEFDLADYVQPVQSTREQRAAALDLGPIFFSLAASGPCLGCEERSRAAGAEPRGAARSKSRE